DPEVTPADNPPDDKARRPGRVLAAKGLHVVPPVYPLPRLRVLDHGIVLVDLVFRVLIARCGRRPMPLQGHTDLSVLHRMHSPPGPRLRLPPRARLLQPEARGPPS